MCSWDDLIEKIKYYIDENIKDTPTLSEISRQLGYSYFYVTKKFHKAEGVSFREYVSTKKIQQAAIDLYVTKEKIIDIAIKYDYSSQEAFTRAFANVFGVSPAVYRRTQKPTPLAEKSVLIGRNNMIGDNKMKFYVKQMYDWNCYAYYAENVDEKYFEYFRSELWWQVGNNFIKQFDNVKDFLYCAKNFTEHGETAIKQQLKIIETPWQSALSLLIPEMKKLAIDWYIHGSTAMALAGIAVAPKDVNIIIPNYSDFDKVRNHFYKLAIRPIERCENWVMSGLGYIFLETVVGFAFGNKDIEPYDMSSLSKITYCGEEIFISTLDMLRQDNEYFDRPERVKLIDDKIKNCDKI